MPERAPLLDARIAALADRRPGPKSDAGQPERADGARPVRWPVRLTTYEPDLDKGVRGFDSVRGIGGSEPTSPERRKRAGNKNNCQL